MEFIARSLLESCSKSVMPRFLLQQKNKTTKFYQRYTAKLTRSCCKWKHKRWSCCHGQSWFNQATNRVSCEL